MVNEGKIEREEEEKEKEKRKKESVRSKFPSDFFFFNTVDIICTITKLTRLNSVVLVRNLDQVAYKISRRLVHVVDPTVQV